VRTFEQLVATVQAEYLEMPGLQLKSAQVQRLCGIEQTICQLVLDALVASKFLCVKANGGYARVNDGPVRRLRPAKANLRTGEGLRDRVRI
jgi:hypothetical protein